MLIADRTWLVWLSAVAFACSGNPTSHAGWWCNQNKTQQASVVQPNSYVAIPTGNGGFVLTPAGGTSQTVGFGSVPTANGFPAPSYPTVWPANAATNPAVTAPASNSTASSWSSIFAPAGSTAAGTLAFYGLGNSHDGVSTPVNSPPQDLAAVPQPALPPAVPTTQSVPVTAAMPATWQPGMATTGTAIPVLGSPATGTIVGAAPVTYTANFGTTPVVTQAAYFAPVTNAAMPATFTSVPGTSSPSAMPVGFPAMGTAGTGPAMGYNSSGYPANVTYYRPVASVDQATGQVVPQMQACTGIECQVQRSPSVTAFAPSTTPAFPPGQPCPPSSFSNGSVNYAPQAPSYPSTSSYPSAVAPPAQYPNLQGGTFAAPSTGTGSTIPPGSSSSLYAPGTVATQIYEAPVVPPASSYPPLTDMVLPPSTPAPAAANTPAAPPSAVIGGSTQLVPPQNSTIPSTASGSDSTIPSGADKDQTPIDPPSLRNGDGTSAASAAGYSAAALTNNQSAWPTNAGSADPSLLPAPTTLKPVPASGPLGASASQKPVAPPLLPGTEPSGKTAAMPQTRLVETAARSELSGPIVDRDVRPARFVDAPRNDEGWQAVDAGR